MKDIPSYPQSIRISDARSDYPSDHYCERAVKLRQFEKAFQTLHDSYHQRKFIASRRAGLWMTRYHLLPTTRVFVVTNTMQATGTLTLVEDGPLGLPIETLFRKEVALRRKHYGPIAEATCLALDERGATAGPEMVDRLMGVVAQAARWSGMTQILISVHPRHVSYYKRMAGFLPIGQPQPYPAVRGHLAVHLALWQDIQSDTQDKISEAIEERRAA